MEGQATKEKVTVNRLGNAISTARDVPHDPPIRGPSALRELRREYPDTPYLFIHRARRLDDAGDGRANSLRAPAAATDTVLTTAPRAWVNAAANVFVIQNWCTEAWREIS